MSFPVANPYLHNASRTNKTSSSGIVREAQREANTDKEKFTKTMMVQRERERRDECVNSWFSQLSGNLLERYLEKLIHQTNVHALKNGYFEGNQKRMESLTAYL